MICFQVRPSVIFSWLLFLLRALLSTPEWILVFHDSRSYASSSSSPVASYILFIPSIFFLACLFSVFQLWFVGLLSPHWYRYRLSQKHSLSSQADFFEIALQASNIHVVSYYLVTDFILRAILGANPSIFISITSISLFSLFVMGLFPCHIALPVELSRYAFFLSPSLVPVCHTLFLLLLPSKVKFKQNWSHENNIQTKLKLIV